MNITEPVVPKQVQHVRDGKCPQCGLQIWESDKNGERFFKYKFKNMLSQSEFLLTGKCQDCQDLAFNSP